MGAGSVRIILPLRQEVWAFFAVAGKVGILQYSREKIKFVEWRPGPGQRSSLSLSASFVVPHGLVHRFFEWIIRILIGVAPK